MPQEIIRGLDLRKWSRDDGLPQGENLLSPRRAHHLDQPQALGGNMQEENRATEQMVETDPVTIVESRFTSGQEITVRDVTHELCIDGRKTGEAGVSVPAGSAGILTVEVNTIQNLTGVELSEEAVNKIVLKSIAKNGGSYLHSDIHAAEHIAEALQENRNGLSEELVSHLSGPEGVERTVELVQNPRATVEELGLPDDPNAVEEAVLDLMVKYMGCGHLAQMNARSGEYDSEHDTVGKVVRSLLRAKWSGENVTIDFLSGDHNELALAKYEIASGISEDTVLTAVVPLENGQGIFPLHGQMAEYRYRQHYADIIAVLEEYGVPVEDITEDEFIKHATALGDKQAGLTMPVLASKLPSKNIPVVAVTETSSGVRNVNLVGSIAA